ncbi:MAG TPA: hypothetical protein VMB21_10215 [Candidatus Limnocylindria bacterium]|nr:hypothetical protein [Candidatus Limnocylindria bacterium]
MHWLEQLRARLLSTTAVTPVDSLLASADPHASLTERIEWLEDLLSWVRRAAPGARLRFLLQQLDRQPEARLRVARVLRSIVRDTQALDLFCETGLPRESGFIREAMSRLGNELLPEAPGNRDLGDVMARLFPSAADVDRLEALDPDLIRSLAELWQHGESADEAGWNTFHDDVEDALGQLATRIRAIGCMPDIRTRLGQRSFRDLPFLKLATAIEQMLTHSSGDTDTASAVAELNYVRALADACDAAVDQVFARLEETGVSIDLVYDLERLRAHLRRLDLLLPVWGDPQFSPERTLAFLTDVVRENHARRSLSGLTTQNLRLFTERLVEHNAETGKHYIARTTHEYAEMLASAAGGGALTALTTWAKLSLAGLALPGFFGGLLAAANYAVSFVLMQCFGFTLATKQPASTAPVLADRMHELRDPRQLEALVDEVTYLIRSQVAAIAGNLGLVIPTVLVINALFHAWSGHHWIGPEKAAKLMASFSPFSGCWLFAAFTGVLLWTASLASGWAGNWFALHQLRAALTEHRRLRRLLGPVWSTRLARAAERNVVGFVGNVAIGILLGMTPEVAEFFGLPLEVRHVTLSTGQLTAALAALGADALFTRPFLLAVVGIAGVAVLNVGVSFALALTVAIRARAVRAPERSGFYRALRHRIYHEPLSFLLPLGRPAGVVGST